MSEIVRNVERHLASKFAPYRCLTGLGSGVCFRRFMPNEVGDIVFVSLPTIRAVHGSATQPPKVIEGSSAFHVLTAEHPEAFLGPDRLHFISSDVLSLALVGH